MENVLDWFEEVIQQKIKIWYNAGPFYDDSIIEWHEGYERKRAQKAKFKEELSPIAWHPDRVKD